MKIAVGDQVRVHFHPPGSMRSFCEGVVSRVDVTTREGRFFVVDVIHEVILDREHSIRRGFQDFVRYDCPSDFPGRIEVLSTAEQTMVSEPLPTALEAQEVTDQGADEPLSAELDVHSGPETEQIPEAEIRLEETPVHAEPQPANSQGGLLATLFGRKK
ncbi:hypothetical protein [Microvirga arabica]|uniref:hypothetical protein n=1 Tax=Microvirga arabica TaxID=1128671 RepID=UPI0019395316|nr:hypothetical protein [Microvirga arabica]MBM1171651.1 hypothetical protein [Microvirga arabica]